MFSSALLLRTRTAESNRRIRARCLLIGRVLGLVYGEGDGAPMIGYHVRGMISMAWHAGLITEREYDQLWSIAIGASHA